VKFSNSIASAIPTALEVTVRELSDMPLGKLGDPVPAASEIESTFIILMVIPPV
jgi:hypothetical protein